MCVCVCFFKALSNTHMHSGMLSVSVISDEDIISFVYPSARWLRLHCLKFTQWQCLSLYRVIFVKKKINLLASLFSSLLLISTKWKIKTTAFVWIRSKHKNLKSFFPPADLIGLYAVQVANSMRVVAADDYFFFCTCDPTTAVCVSSFELFMMAFPANVPGSVLQQRGLEESPGRHLIWKTSGFINNSLSIHRVLFNYSGHQ